MPGNKLFEQIYQNQVVSLDKHCKKFSIWALSDWYINTAYQISSRSINKHRKFGFIMSLWFILKFKVIQRHSRLVTKRFERNQFTTPCTQADILFYTNIKVSFIFIEYSVIKNDDDNRIYKLNYTITIIYLILIWSMHNGTIKWLFFKGFKLTCAP